MLPFLKRKMPTLMVMKKAEGGAIEDQPETDQGLIQAATDLLKAIEAKNPDAVASALQAAFDICDSYEDEEGEAE